MRNAKALEDELGPHVAYSRADAASADDTEALMNFVVGTVREARLRGQ